VATTSARIPDGGAPATPQREVNHDHEHRYGGALRADGPELAPSARSHFYSAPRQFMIARLASRRLMLTARGVLQQFI
jgi:hypothetical protein